jgi:tRNA(Arg) A34 adenosine deaminase TadA
MTDHEPFIRRTFELAKQSVSQGSHPFGALLARHGDIVLEAENQVGHCGCTAHAELELVRLASTKLTTETLSECTLYTSTEPCPMCAGAIFWAGIPRVVYSVPAALLLEHTRFGMEFSVAELYAGATRTVEVVGPVLPAEGMKLHLDYWGF